METGSARLEVDVPQEGNRAGMLRTRFIGGILGVLAIPARVSAAGDDGLGQRIQAIIDDYARRAYAAGLPITIEKPTLVLQATPQIASYQGKTNTVVLADYAGLPPEIKMVFAQWAAAARNGWDGERLVDEAFHWFFVAHELTHWVQIKTPVQVPGDIYEFEFQANRSAVGYWRSTPGGSARLDALVKAFVAIRATLPNPVPEGDTAQHYFNENYRSLGVQPAAYGWY